MKTIYDIVEYMKTKRVNPLTVDAWEMERTKRFIIYRKKHINKLMKFCV